MLVSKQFLKDFAELANRYQWDGAVLEDVKQQTRDSPELKAFWSELAEAHRQGYRQTKQNGWQTLGQWKTWY